MASWNLFVGAPVPLHLELRLNAPDDVDLSSGVLSLDLLVTAPDATTQNWADWVFVHVGRALAPARRSYTNLEITQEGVYRFSGVLTVGSEAYAILPFSARSRLYG